MNAETQFENSSIRRAPRDKEHPYLMVSKALIRDASISPQCSWLLINLLCNVDHWEINIRQVVNQMKGRLGRDKIYQLFEEAIQAGYINKIEYLENGLLRIKYEVDEIPKFKKSLPLPEIQDTGLQDTENQEASLKSNIPKEYNHKRTTTPPTPSKGGQPAKPASAADDSIEGQIKRSKLTADQQAKAIEFYKSNKAIVDDPKIDNKVGYLIHLVTSGRYTSIAEEGRLKDMRKIFAKKMGTVTSNAGCYEPGEEGILKMSGSKQEMIRYDQEHDFWNDRGLGNPSKNDFKG